MNDNMSAPTPMPDAPKKNNTPMIIAVVVIVVLCCCCLAGGLGYYFYQNGDKIFNAGAMLLSAM